MPHADRQETFPLERGLRQRSRLANGLRHRRPAPVGVGSWYRYPTLVLTGLRPYLEARERRARLAALAVREPRRRSDECYGFVWEDDRERHLCACGRL